MKFITRFPALLTAFFLTSLAAFAGDPNGTWTFTTTGPRGNTIESTLHLVWADGRLTGTIDNRAGKTAIVNATFANEQIAFAVEREMRGREITLLYAGKLEGDKITGTISTAARKNKPVALPWQALRAQ